MEDCIEKSAVFDSNGLTGTKQNKLGGQFTRMGDNKTFNSLPTKQELANRENKKGKNLPLQGELSEQTKNEYRSRLTMLSRKVLDDAQNTESIVGAAEYFYDQARRWNFVYGKEAELVTAACLYLGIRVQDNPPAIRLIDIAAVLGRNVFDITPVFFKIARKCHFQGQELNRMDPKALIRRFAKNLKFSSDKVEKLIISTSLKMFDQMKKDWINAGRRTSGICGACLFIASRIHKEPRSMDAIVKEVKVGFQTLENRLREFERTKASRLTAKDWNNDKHKKLKAHYPPSFVRNRILEEKIRKEEERIRKKRKREGGINLDEKEPPPAPPRKKKKELDEPALELAEMSSASQDGQNLDERLIKEARNVTEQFLVKLGDDAEVKTEDGELKVVVKTEDPSGSKVVVKTEDATTLPLKQGSEPEDTLDDLDDDPEIKRIVATDEKEIALRKMGFDLLHPDYEELKAKREANKKLRLERQTAKKSRDQGYTYRRDQPRKHSEMRKQMMADEIAKLQRILERKESVEKREENFQIGEEDDVDDGDEMDDDDFYDEDEIVKPEILNDPKDSLACAGMPPLGQKLKKEPKLP